MTADINAQFSELTFDLRVEAACERVVNMLRLYRRLGLPAPIMSASMALEVAAGGVS